MVGHVRHVDVLLVLGVPLLILAILVSLFTVCWVSVYCSSAFLSSRGWFSGVRLAASCSRPSFPVVTACTCVSVFSRWRFLVLGSVVFPGPLLVVNVTSYTSSCLTLRRLPFQVRFLSAFALSHPRVSADFPSSVWNGYRVQRPVGLVSATARVRCDCRRDIRSLLYRAVQVHIACVRQNVNILDSGAQHL